MADFPIFELPVGGGVVALSPVPGRNGSYAANLSIMLRWGADIVLSMTTSAELAQFSAERLGAELGMSNVVWLHLPIDDYGIPRTETQARWLDAETECLRVLEQGGRVLAHCRGGCGRSGMAVLRLMIANGEEPESALARLRTVRPCAVETDAQFEWAKKGV